VVLVVPGGMAVVAEDQLGADAGDFAGGLRGLGVAEVAEELNSTFQAFGCDGVGCALSFEFEHVENLRARGEQPAESIGEGEGHALALSVIKLVASGSVDL